MCCSHITRSPEVSRPGVVTSGTRPHLSTLLHLHSDGSHLMRLGKKHFLGIITGKKKGDHKRGQRECQLPLFLFKSLPKSLLSDFFSHTRARTETHSWPETTTRVVKGTGLWVGTGMATLLSCFLKRLCKFTLPAELVPSHHWQKFKCEKVLAI